MIRRIQQWVTGWRKSNSIFRQVSFLSYSTMAAGKSFSRDGGCDNQENEYEDHDLYSKGPQTPLTTTTTSSPLVCQPNWLSSKESYSLLLLLLSTFFYSVMSCFLQLSSRNDGIPSTQLVLFRAVFQGTLVVVTMGIFDPKLLSRPFGDSVSVQKLVVARGIVGGARCLLSSQSRN